MLPKIAAYDSDHYKIFLSSHWFEMNNLDNEKACHMKLGH